MNLYDYSILNNLLSLYINKFMDFDFTFVLVCQTVIFTSPLGTEFKTFLHNEDILERKLNG